MLRTSAETKPDQSGDIVNAVAEPKWPLSLGLGGMARIPLGLEDVVRGSGEQSQKTGVQGMGPCWDGALADHQRAMELALGGRVSQGPVTDGERPLLG